MRLAMRALTLALTLLVLCAAVSAQTLRNENDPRNISPSVGTGGPPGGSTGLFTIFNGKTLHKGESTFNNVDRAAGFLPMVMPLGFDVRESGYVELCSNKTAPTQLGRRETRVFRVLSMGDLR